MPKTSVRTRSFLLGIAVVVVIAILAVIAITANAGLPFAKTTKVTAQFKDVGGLQVGNEVRENSVRIGQVSELTHKNGVAQATLSLDGDVPIYRDAHAAIWDQSALAQKFVELDVGHRPAGPLNGSVLPANRNVNSSDLDQVLDVFDEKTRSQLTSAVRQLGGGVAGHSRDLHQLLTHAPSTLDDVSTVSSALTDKQANLPGLLDSANHLAGAFNGHEEQLSGLVDQLNGTLQAVNVDNARPLHDTLKELPPTLSDVRRNFRTLDAPLDDTQSALTTLRPGAESLGQATPDLRGVLREGVPPLDRVPNVAQQATPAVGDLTSAVKDLRPLSPRLSEALTNASVPLAVLAPYTRDFGNFWNNVNSLVSTQTAPGQHVARLGVALEPSAYGLGSVAKDPLLGRDPYAPPGQGSRDRTVPLVPGVTGDGK